MAFGGGSSFSFGSTNNNQSTGFGGFGKSTNNNTTTGFGSTSNTGFGSTTTTANPFGGGGTGFGSNTGGAFGSNNNAASPSLFGNNTAAKPSAFGSSTTGNSLFGGNANANTTSAFGGGSGGGFGATNNNAFSSGNTNAFGSNNTAPPFAFGAPKPSISTGTGGALFGAGGAGTTGGFGAAQSSFGSPGSGTALNQNVPPSEGTAGPPFNPTVESEGTGNTKNSYQSIVFQQPYMKYSFEELRLADYNANRRFGNSNGQGGAFGSSTFGGGFGNTNATNSAFGANNNNNNNPFGGTSNSTALGGNSATTGGFGGSLFGNNANKTGLFGQSTSAPSTGLFGTANNTTNTSFGTNTTSSPFGTGAGTGIFGGANQTQKPPSLFGSANTATNTGSGFNFGASNNASGGTGPGLFGANNTNNANNSNAFGTNQQNSSLFGQNNPTQPKSLFGGSSGFGTSTTQSQPGGNLFAPSSGSIFNNTNNQPQTNSLFNPNPTGNTTSLFGGNNTNTQQTKPSLFSPAFGGGSNTGTTNTGGSLFPSNNTSQPQNNSVFNNPNTGSTFGFGNANNKPATNPLFGSNNTTNNPNTGLFGSANNNTSGGIFSNSSQLNLQNSMQQQDGPKHASQLESSPFTQSSIWTGLPQATAQNSAPLLTPLSASSRLKESASKPPVPKLPQSRYNTPTRRPGGFGFSYSTYGTPNSAASTPGGSGLAAGMYNSRGFTGGSFGRSLHKSYSSSTLRGSYGMDMESILTPGAFTPGSSRYSSGSIRRLTIDRSIKSDLFSRPSQPAIMSPSSSSTNGTANVTASTVSPSEEGIGEQPSKLKKRVSFEKDVTGGSNSNTLNGETGALVRTEQDDGESNETPRVRRGKGTAGPPEMEQARGKELAMVPEDRESDIVSSMRLPTDVVARADPEPGAYFMRPSRSEISKMPRDKLQKFTDFVVGRKGCGFVTFNGAVDLTTLALDDVFDKIVEIRLRSITVYPDASTKPPPGKGLNVPSTLYIENSWPRARNMPSSATSGPIYDKHINRLKKMSGTVFLNYENATGVWTFRVPHYTRYGLDYDEDEAEDVENESSSLSPPPEDIQERSPQFPSGDVSGMDLDSGISEESSPEDDTFAFKQKTVPGSYGHQSIADYEEESDLEESTPSEAPSDNEMSMAGTFPLPQAVSLDSPNRPILRSRLGTPGRPLLDLDGDWADQLQRTISPRKQNREALREIQSKVLLDRVYEPIKPQRATSKPEFRNSLDIMNSLFGKHEERVAAARRKELASPDFEFPYSKRPKLFQQDAKDMTQVDQAFHSSFKPKFTSTGQLLHHARGISHSSANVSGWSEKSLMEDAGGQLIVSSLKGDGQESLVDLQTLASQVDIILREGVPFAQHKRHPFSVYSDRLRTKQGTSVLGDATSTEAELYELAHVLFDDFDDEFGAGLTNQQKHEFDFRIRKDRLAGFLSSRVLKSSLQSTRDAEQRNLEEAAILHLASKNVQGACQALKRARDFHLMMLIAQIERTDDVFQLEMETQVAEWRNQDIISEMSEPIRALYGILGGNTTDSVGKSNGPVEDRASTFSLSERFGLDWFQAFCLCLWYGRHKNGSIQDAVADFAEKIESGREPARPYADGTQQVSPLWVLLKLYASTKGPGTAAPVLPQALNQLSQPFDARVTFQMHHALTSSLPSGLEIDAEKADALALEVAFQLSAAGDFLGAAYALLHIPDADKRRTAVRDLLMRFGAHLPDEPDARTTDKAQLAWQALTVDLKIPQAWIFEAKAQFARAQNDSLAELRYLVRAEQWDVAHECLCRRVAPRTVIDEDWELLQSQLALFGADVGARVGGWAAGGAVYGEFVQLVSLGAGEGGEGDVRKLQHSLAEMGARFRSRGANLMAGGVEELEERVACREMSSRVADVMMGVGVDGGLRADVLELPVTADRILGITRGLSGGYYHGVMVGAH